MNRCARLRRISSFTISCLLFPLPGLTAQPVLHVERYRLTEIALESARAYAHPHKSVDVRCEFSGPDGSLTNIRGFWDGGLLWRVRFAPPVEGLWQYRTICSDPENHGLHDRRGLIQVGPYTGTNPFAHKGWLAVAPNGRYLTYGNGEPFFWLGDTAWEITWKSHQDELQRYLADRSAKEFTVIQVVAMSHQHLEEFGVRNRMGEPFFLNDDFSMPNPRYFDYLDLIIQAANERGMAVALVPLWAAMNVLHFDPRYQRFSLSREESLLLARYIGARYAGSNVIWIVGGDNRYDTPERKAFWREFARQLREASGGTHLITVHPQGWTSSSDSFDNHTTWLNFHMYQSSHKAGASYTYSAALRGYALTPAKPVLNGEAVYEDIYDNLWTPGDTRHVETFRIRPEHIRQASYESVLSGALVGMTYGANGVWQWSTPEDPGTHSPRFTVDHAWMFPGSAQMTVFKTLMVHYNWYRLIPKRTLLLNTSPRELLIPIAASDEHLLAYFPQQTVAATINCRRFSQGTQYVWINPTNGETSPQSQVTQGLNAVIFTPPDASDWLLVVAPDAMSFRVSSAAVPTHFELSQNTPNPFNPTTRIEYRLPRRVHVRLLIYNVQGQEVRRLVDAEQQVGVYRVEWNGLNDAGKPVASDIYLYRLQADEFTRTRKMVLVR